MKTIIALFAAALVVLSPVLAGEHETTTFDRAVAVKNLLNNLNSENKGVRESSASMLGDLKAEEGAMPLIAMLQNDPNESSRIVAALSLSKIGEARGTSAVRQAVRSDESRLVRLLCAWFTNQYTKPEPFEIIPLDDARGMQIVERQEDER